MKTVKTAQNNAATKTGAPNTKAPIVKPETTKKQAAAKPTLEERIQRADELRSLTLKRQRTVDTLHNIRTFSFASDDSCVLILKDSKGQSFETGNTNLINLLKDYLTTLLNDKVSALDDEILGFTL